MGCWQWRGGVAGGADWVETEGFLQAMGAGNKDGEEKENVPVVEPKNQRAEELEFYSTYREKNDSCSFFG